MIPTPCVLTRKDRTYAAVLRDIVEMEKLVQVSLLGQENFPLNLKMICNQLFVVSVTEDSFAYFQLTLHTCEFKKANFDIAFVFALYMVTSTFLYLLLLIRSISCART